MKYLPYGLFLTALGIAYAFSHTTDPGLKRLESGVTALLFGASGILWGVNELREGRALVLTQTAAREEQPIVFWTVIVLLRFAIGLVLLAAGVWKLMGGQAS